jgi:hypothetical protein
MIAKDRPYYFQITVVTNVIYKQHERHTYYIWYKKKNIFCSHGDNSVYLETYLCNR